ncbi:IclR family transcriptional regulator [Actinoplanes sp. NPDC051475]|uniref:IclR family transcriptional regulator n=1 Tax=Actinoplanes sp. NPDC051475 TaxID=3157225 RepID=UPI003450B0A1
MTDTMPSEFASIRSISVPSGKNDRESSGLELVSKVGAVLDALERSGELTATELAAATGEPLSSIYRLLRSLNGIGWLDKGIRRGGYRLGLHFLTVGAALEDSIDIREAALPSLRRLVAETGATSFLCIRRAGRAVCVERIEGTAVRSLALELGNSLPLYSGAAPRALLAYLPVAEQLTVLRDSVPLPGDPVAPSPAAILADAELSRSAGYTVSDEDVTPGIAALGAPVFDHAGDLAAAISISGLQAQVLGDHAEANIALIQTAAAAVSGALGNPLPGGKPIVR